MSVIEKSKRLEECAYFLEVIAPFFSAIYSGSRADFKQWAYDIRSIIIPEPLNETENLHSKDIEG